MRKSFTAALIFAAILVVACGGGAPAAAPPPAPDVAPPPPSRDTQAAQTAAVAPSPQPQTTAPQEPGIAVGNKVGNRAPDFRVTTFDGVTVTPADLKGKPYILYFFATW